MLYAYIDETGDRGLASTGGSSPIFGMAAVIVTDESAPVLRSAVAQIRKDFGVPDGVVMSWKQHAKTHDRKKHAARILAGVEGIKVIFVYCQKDRVEGKYHEDRTLFYNYVASKMYTNILWAASFWPKQRGVHTRFGHVKGHDHRGTARYLALNARMNQKVRHDIEQGLKWVSADKYLESQAADLYGGFLKAALWPAGPFGYVEPQYLQTIWHQVRRGRENCPLPLGFMPMPSNELVNDLEWYSCAHCEKKKAN